MITIYIRKSEQTNEEYALFISFPYNADIIDIIREQLVRYWNKENKEWEVPFSSLKGLLDSFNFYGFDVDICAESGDVFRDVAADVPVEFEYKTTPFEHQREALAYGLAHSKWLLGDEMGLGKTKQAIDIAVAKKLQNGYKHCLILCCVNGLKWNWQSEVKKHSNENCWILGQKLKRDRMKNIRMVVGSSQDKLEDLAYLQMGGNTDIDDSYFIITNVESLRYREWTGEYKTSRNGKRVKVYDYPIADRLAELCNSGVIDMIVADEIHLGVKNPDSEQGRAFLKLNAKTMIGMTGTPLMNSPTDLYMPLKWLGVESHSQYNFNHHYCVYGGYGDYQVIGHKNLDELQKRLDTIMLRRKKADVLDLPEKIYINEYVDMTAKQAVIYNEVTMDVQSNIDQIKSSTNPLSELIRLRQATGYTGILSSQVQESAKLDRLVEIVKDTLSNDQQLVIFSNWTQMTDAIETRLVNNEIYSYGVITGNTKDEERQAIVNAFQNGEIKIIVGTIGAAGTGITLTAGTVEIFLDEPWNRAKKEQAEDRCHRVGQKSNLTIYTLITKNTIDERINELVQEKGEMADMLVDGKINAKDKSELVDYLLS